MQFVICFVIRFWKPPFCSHFGDSRRLRMFERGYTKTANCEVVH